MSYLSTLRPGTAIPSGCYTFPSSLIHPDVPLHSYGHSLHTMLIADLDIQVNFSSVTPLGLVSVGLRRREKITSVRQRAVGHDCHHPHHSSTSFRGLGLVEMTDFNESQF
jgi:hypothetical protein